MLFKKLLPLLVMLALWEWGIRYIERGTFFYGSPALIIKALWSQIETGALLRNTGFTLAAVLAGFALGNALGVLVGGMLAYRRSVAEVATPYLVVMGSAPIFAFAPIIVLWFGIGLTSKIAMAAFSTMVVAATQTFEGAKQVPPSSIALLESLGATRWTVFRKIVAPASLVWLFSGLKLNVGVAILAVFIGEFISAEAGLGYQIVIDMGLFKTSSVLGGVLAISLLSLGLNGLVNWLQRVAMPWKAQP